MKQKIRVKYYAFLITCVVLILLSGVSLFVYAAETANKPVQMKADEVTYIQSKNLIVAKGKVEITQEDGRLFCDYAEYNEKTLDAHLVGNVKALKADAVMQAEEVFGYLNKKLVAVGNASLSKGEKHLYGPRIEYDSEMQYARVPNGARFVVPDGVMTCDSLESWLNIDRAIANGNVHLYSEKQGLEVTAGHAEYYGDKSGALEPYVVLTIKPHVIRNGSTMDSDIVTVYMLDNAAGAEGKGSKLKFGEGGN